MAQNSDLKTRLVVIWKTKKPRWDSPCKSSTFYVFDSGWYLKMSYNPCNDHRSTVTLYAEVGENWYRLKKPFRVTTFIEDEMNTSVHLLPSERTVEATEQKLWIYKDAQISKCVPRFRDGAEFKIVCVFHDVPPTTLQTKNETTSTSTQTDFDRPLSSRQCSTNLPKGKLSSVKYVQTTPDLSPDLESLSTDLCNLLENKTIPDVKLRCGHRTISAHRAVLAARSEVFAAMFQNKMTESETGIVDVTDVDAPVLELFLKYVYSGRIPDLSDDTAPSLYEAGDKYAVQALKKSCSNWMVGGLCEENCLGFLTLADTHSDSNFKDAVVNFVVEHMEVLRSQEWFIFKKDHPIFANEVYEIILNRKYFGGTVSK